MTDQDNNIEQQKFPKHTEEELRQLASDIFDGKVFTHIHIIHSGGKPEDLGLVFLPLVYADQKIKKMVADILGEGGMIYEYMTEAGPRGINGMPNFCSCKLLCGVESAFVTKLHDEILANHEAFLAKGGKE